MQKTTLSPEVLRAAHQATAKAIQHRLFSVDPAKIAVVSMERNLPRKDLAKLARGVFAKLGVKGISITAPNYSMAQSVDVRVPRLLTDSIEDSAEYVLTRKDNNETVRKVEAILLAAFPNTDNRSDSMTDYFDYRWSVGTSSI